MLPDKIKVLGQGLVIKSTGGAYIVKLDNGEALDCKIRGKFRMKGIETTNPIAVGDVVDFTKDEKSELGVITHIHQRKNYIIRKSINLSHKAHILAANVDQALLIVTLAKPKTYPEFIDRFLVSAEAYTIPAKIIFNKIDLYDPTTLAEMHELISLYTNIGYVCYSISAKHKQGLSEVAQLLAGKISVIAGHSGIGKSTLINAIEPGLNLKTKEISEVHDAGMHTTTYPEMHALSNQGYIIDTPGVKGFGVIDIEKEELSHFFPEIFATGQGCRFFNCTHSHEPNCAVKQAVEKGEIGLTRYKSYTNLLAGDDDEKYRANAYD